MESKGTADLVCPEGKTIVINAPGCVIKVGPQNGLGPIFYKTNTGTPSDVTIEPKVTNISYTVEGIICGSSSASNGTYTGNVTITGDNELGEQTSVSVG